MGVAVPLILVVALIHPPHPSASAPTVIDAVLQASVPVEVAVTHIPAEVSEAVAAPVLAVAIVEVAVPASAVTSR